MSCTIYCLCTNHGVGLHAYERLNCRANRTLIQMCESETTR